MIDINNIKGLQELFKEKAFAITSTEKLIESIYPIIRLANFDIDDSFVWDICAEIIMSINEYQLYKFYADNFHYDIFYDFEDELHIVEKHEDLNHMIFNTLNGKEFTCNGKQYIIEGNSIKIIFDLRDVE